MKVLVLLALVVAAVAVNQAVDEKITDLCHTMGYTQSSHSRKLLGKSTTIKKKRHTIVPSLIGVHEASGEASGAADAAGAAKADGKKTIIAGACPYPPYAYYDKDKGEVDPTAPKGSPWTGFSVEMFETIARNMSVDIKYVNGTYAEHIAAMEKGEIDTIVAGVFYTKRIRNQYPTWEFSHAFWQSGISVLVPAPKHPSAFTAVMSDTGMWSMVAALIGTLVASGFVFWYLEKKSFKDRPPEYFKDEDGNYIPDRIPQEFGPGFGIGVWLSTTTVTTVGYGDSYPRTWAGKSWAMFIMFASLFLIAAFTGAVTSAMTVSAVSGGGNGINGINDVDGRNVGVLEGSFPDHYMTANRPKAKIHRYPRMKVAVEAMLDHKVDAIVGVTDVLQFQNAKHPEDTVMVGYPFRQHSIVWPFDDGSSNIKKQFGGNKQAAIEWTQTLLRLEDFEKTDAIIQKYFGA